MSLKMSSMLIASSATSTLFRVLYYHSFFKSTADIYHRIVLISWLRAWPWFFHFVDSFCPFDQLANCWRIRTSCTTSRRQRRMLSSTRSLLRRIT
jgi:hypothetical protein